MSTLRIKGRGLVGGRAAGYALVTKSAFTFAHGVDPRTGLITDPRSGLKGQSLKGKVLVFPHGRGSTTGPTWFLETVRNQNHPAAIINHHSEPIIVIGAVLAKLLYGQHIPVVSGFKNNPAETINTGDFVSVDGDKGLVRIRRRRD
jgi:predicted aconitase with swiveling domain